MFKPLLYSTQKDREILNSFRGYENNPVIEENAFLFEENMSSDQFPLVSPRNKRAFFNVSGNRLHGLFSKEKICYINNGILFYGGQAVNGLTFPDTEKERTFVSMGTKILVFPDKLYVNTKDFSDFGSLEASYTTEKVQCTLCRGDGDLYEGYYVSVTPPENPEHGDLWVDTSLSQHALKQYSAETQTWIELEDKFIRITSVGLGKAFNRYDGVTITGLESIGIEGVVIVHDKGDDYIVVSGMLDTNVEISDYVTIERKLPHLDYVCESGNRLWGCSSQTNEIFASALGDPTNFFCYRGISTDSYAASVGSDGEFTGVHTYRGYVLFFKENCVHKVYGSNPPYTITTSYINGVQKGSHNSLCNLNGTLYYKAPDGIYSYEGGIPVKISGDLGKDYFTSAVAGVLKSKYYVCMTDVFNSRILFAYDEEKGIWHREGEFNVISFAQNNLNLYFICEKDGTKRLGLVDSVNKYGNFTGELSGYMQEEDFSWLVESGLWGLDLPDNKYYSNIIIRAIGEKSSKIQVNFEFDSSGKWENQFSCVCNKTGSYTMPFITPRCDHMRMQIKGQGNVKILSISRNIETGSELNV